LEQHKAEIEAVGLRIVNIGLGRPEHAERYCGKLAPNLTCFAATDNEPYYAYGLRQSTTGELLKTGIGLLRATATAMRAGHSQSKSTGDVAMMPGTFIVDEAGVLRYCYYSQYAGDDPSIEQLIEFARQMR